MARREHFDQPRQGANLLVVLQRTRKLVRLAVPRHNEVSTPHSRLHLLERRIGGHNLEAMAARALNAIAE